jgi:hypothetical protein
MNPFETVPSCINITIPTMLPTFAAFHIQFLRNLGSLLQCFCLVFPSVIQTVFLYHLSILGTEKIIWERAQGCRLAAEKTEFVSCEKRLDGQYHLQRSVMVKKPTVFPTKFQLLLSLAFSVIAKMIRWSS